MYNLLDVAVATVARNVLSHSVVRTCLSPRTDIQATETFRSVARHVLSDWYVLHRFTATTATVGDTITRGGGLYFHKPRGKSSVIKHAAVGAQLSTNQIAVLTQNAKSRRTTNEKKTRHSSQLAHPRSRDD